MPHFDEAFVRFDDPLVYYDDPRGYQEILNLPNSPAMFDVVLDLRNLSVAPLIVHIWSILTATAGQAATQVTALGAKVDTLEAKESAL